MKNAFSYLFIIRPTSQDDLSSCLSAGKHGTLSSRPRMKTAKDPKNNCFKGFISNFNTPWEGGYPPAPTQLPTRFTSLSRNHIVIKPYQLACCRSTMTCDCK